MKRILTILAIALSMFTMSFSWSGIQPALADVSEGEKIFNNSCAACHAGGLNRVVAAKNLKLAALEKYGMNSVEAIATQVTKGKGAMPAFGKKLSAEEINAVAAYVLEKAEQGWTKA